MDGASARDGKGTHKTFVYHTHLRLESGGVASLGSWNHPAVRISSPAPFKGFADLWTPEEFFVGAVEACLMLTFLAAASSQGVEVLSYSSEAEGTLEIDAGKYRFTHVTVLPRIIVSDKTHVDGAAQALERARRNCIVSNSIRPSVTVVPTIEWEPRQERAEGP
jgi:organic hydroperoxide reductase OsmC/OhrA